MSAAPRSPGDFQALPWLLVLPALLFYLTQRLVEHGGLPEDWSSDPRIEHPAKTDVPATFADVDDLIRDVDFKPATSIEDGIASFVEWYRDYHKV